MNPKLVRFLEHANNPEFLFDGSGDDIVNYQDAIFETYPGNLGGTCNCHGYDGVGHLWALYWEECKNRGFELLNSKNGT